MFVLSCPGLILKKKKKKKKKKTNVQISRPINFEPISAMAQLLERSVYVREAVGSILDRVIPKTLKMVLAALSFALSIKKAELVGPVSV